MKLNKFEKLLNVLPMKKFNCDSCKIGFHMQRGEARYSKRKYKGPFCDKCGEKAR